MKRFVEIGTPLEPDALLFHKMRAKEELSRLSEYELDLLSPDGAIKLDEVLGESVTVKLQLADDSVRSFSGYVTRIAQVGMHGRYHAYRAMVRPWLWFLTRTSNCRIFQEKNVPDILKEVFADHSGIADVKFELTESYSPWLYCVQYRETDFDFVSRLMEDEGIYYYFKHSEGRHTLVVADSYSAHSVANGGEIPFIDPEKLVRSEREHVSEWSVYHELQPGKYALTDYDFEKPSVNLLVQSKIKREHALAEYELFDYPGGYLERGDGETYVRTRIEEEQAKFERMQGTTNARALATGYLFTLTDHPREDQNTEYLVVSAEHELQSNEYEAMETAGAEYRCRFSTINSQQPFRPQRLTRKPVVQGPQTAVVVGPAGEEIHTDDQARVKVQFHWDRYGQRDEHSSCWIRVSQPWAGKGWGSVAIPRIGQEVVVSFLEGDPDAPLITGNVYNAEQTPPYTGGVVSGLMSKTHKGSGNNSISMDDTAGKENLAVNGQFDMNTTVGNNQNNTVAVDQTNNVGSNQKEDIGANRDVSIGAKHTMSVGGDEKVTVSGSRDATVAGKEDVSISGKSSLQVGATRMETIAGPHTIVNPQMTITTASRFTVAAGSNLTGTSPKVNLLAGSTFLANSGGKMDVKSAAALTQQSGAAMNINAGAGLSVQSKAAMNLKSGAAMKSQAGGAMNLKAGGAISGKGSVIKLNSPTKIKGTTLTVK